MDNADNIDMCQNSQDISEAVEKPVKTSRVSRMEFELKALRSCYGAKSRPSDGMDAKDMNIFQFTESNAVLTSKRKRKSTSDNTTSPNKKQSLQSPVSSKRLTKSDVSSAVQAYGARHQERRKRLHVAVHKHQARTVLKDRAIIKTGNISKKAKVKSCLCRSEIKRKDGSKKNFSASEKSEKFPTTDTSSCKVTTAMTSKRSTPNSIESTKSNKKPRLAPNFKAVFLPVTIKHDSGKNATLQTKSVSKDESSQRNGYIKRSESASARLQKLSNKIVTASSTTLENSEPQTALHNKKTCGYTVVPRFDQVVYKQFDGYVQIAICPKRDCRSGCKRQDLTDDEVTPKPQSLQSSLSQVQYNCLTPSMLNELCLAFDMAQESACKTVLLLSAGPIFCSGFDLRYFIFNASECNKAALSSAVDAIRKFVNCLIHFPKPIVVAVQGPAVGLGASLLCLCDVVLADENACIQFPYPQQGLTPDCCASYLLPILLNQSMANSLLYGSRTLTADQACTAGIFSEVLPHQTFLRHVIPRVRDICASSSVSLTATKRLMRSRHLANLVCANESESRSLRHCLSTSECLRTMHKYTNLYMP